MKIFIRSGGGAFNRAELIGFVRRGLRGAWYTGFRQAGDVVQCHVVRVMDTSARQVHYHGLIDVRPNRMGWQLISRLDGQRLCGQAVQVRKWFDRTTTTSNDRRQARELDSYPEDRDRRRQLERRRLVRVQLLDDLPGVVGGSADGVRRIA